MQYRHLGNTGIKVSEISLGGWLTFDPATNGRAGREVLDKALECGVNFLDTANEYGKGVCESAWGDLLSHYRRSSVVLATKVYFPMDDGPNDRGLSRKHIMEQCHASLKRLKTDYIDLYQCHRYDDETPLEETIRAMDDLISQGKVHYWGFSQWPADKIRRAFEICGDRFYAPVSSQPKYNILIREIEQEVMPLCADNGVGQVVYCPLEQGLLTGKYKPGQPFPEDSRAIDDTQNHFMKHLAADHKILESVHQLHPVAEEAGCTLAQLALAWVLRRPEISSCITGATRPSQVEENCNASGIELSEEQLNRIDEITLPVTYSFN